MCLCSLDHLNAECLKGSSVDMSTGDLGIILCIYFLNGFLPVLGSLSAHRDFSHLPQTGTCCNLSPIQVYGTMHLLYFKWSSTLPLFCSDVWYDPSQTFVQPDGHFRLSASRCLCRHLSMSRVLVPQHTLFFLL